MPSTPSNFRRTTAQVAVEAIANEYGHGYDVETIAAVIAEAEAVGVASFYVDMIRPLVEGV